MIKSLTPMTLAALMALPLPVMAQDTAGAAETEESQPAAEATTEAPKADDVLDLGQPVQDGPQLGQRYSKETHGDWDLACVKKIGRAHV